MKTKIFSLFAICFICVAVLSGCSSVSYTFIQNADGSISENFSATIYPEEMQGIDCAAFSQKVKQVADTWVSDHATQLSTQGVSCDGAQLTDEGGRYLISITINYVSSIAYKNAWQSGGGGSSDPVIERGVFEDKYIIYRGQTEFAGSLTSTMATSLKDWLTTNYPDYNWQDNLQNISGTYSRVYPSSIAPNIDDGGYRLYVPRLGYTYLIWQFNMTDPDFEITMYKNVVTAHNKANWLLLALGITAVCGVILFFCLRKRKRKMPQQVIDEFTQNTAMENDVTNDETILLDDETLVENKSIEEDASTSLEEQQINEKDSGEQKTADEKSTVKAPKKVRAKPTDENEEK